MKVVCPSCGTTVPGADIDVSSGRAVCRPCGEVILLAFAENALVPPPAPGSNALSEEAARALVTPAFKPSDLKLTEERDGHSWLFTLQPGRAAAVPLLAFAGVWNAFLVFWYAMALGPAAGGPGGIMLWFPLLHVGAGLFITYQGLVRLLNSTRVRLDDARFSVRQGPIPGRNALESAGNVLRFETGVRTSNLGRRGDATQSWVVKMLTRDGRQVDLPITLANADHAAHVAHRLNAALDANRAPVGYRG